MIEIDVGPGGIDFIRSRLECGHYLAHALLQALPQYVGRVSTFVPSSLPATDVENFRAGGKLPQASPKPYEVGSLIAPVTTAYGVLADVMEKYLAESPQHVVVIENSNAERAYPYVARFKSRVAYFGDEVLHVIIPGDSRAQVETTIRESHSIPIYVGVLSATTSPLGAKQSFSAAELDNLAGVSSAIFVGAYDGEGFLILRKRQT